jgi:hypothetical protein
MQELQAPTTFCAENALKLAVHPPCSPDLALSDFLLFGHVKYCLQGKIFQSREELIEALHEIVTAMPPETLHGVF